MNFLLHRHFATREIGADAAGFGAMLPDLVRWVDRRMRPRLHAAPSHADLGSIGAELRRGIDHHLEADVWFHRTRTFREGEARTAAAFRELSEAAPRMTLFAHVAWEMCLDGAWLQTGDGVDASIGSLARDVERFAAEAGGVLHESTSSKGASSPELARRLEPLWARLPDLAAGYARGEGVARRLDGIRRSVGLPRATEPELERWAEVLDARLADAAESLPALEVERTDARSCQRLEGRKPTRPSSPRKRT